MMVPYPSAMCTYLYIAYVLLSVPLIYYNAFNVIYIMRET